MNWLPWPVLPKKRYSHQVQGEAQHHSGGTSGHHRPRTESRTQGVLPTRMAFGRGGPTLAFLEAENVDWENHVNSYARKKTGLIAIMRFDEDMEEILRDLPGSGPLFPYLRSVRAGDRATEFKQRCVGLKIKGVSLHSYRYAWAERAKTAGYPERFAQEALGHNSKAMTRGVFAQGQSGTGRSLGAYENGNARSS